MVDLNRARIFSAKAFVSKNRSIAGRRCSRADYRRRSRGCRKSVGVSSGRSVTTESILRRAKKSGVQPAVTMADCAGDMPSKIDILETLGETSLLLPESINRALAANDRIKYFLTLLQSARDHANRPDADPPSLRREREASGVDDSSFDDVASGRGADNGGDGVPSRWFRGRRLTPPRQLPAIHAARVVEGSQAGHAEPVSARSRPSSPPAP